MRKAKRLIIGLAAAIIGLSAASCTKEDNTLRYNNATMGNIVDGVFISDQGNIFNIVEQTCQGKLETKKRAFIICDVLESAENSTETLNAYNIRLNYIADVLTKDAVPYDSIENPETYMNDPLVLIDLWISGGYMNLYFMAPVKRTDGKVHELNLVYSQEEGVYKFGIRHNAEGEILKEGAENDLIFSYGYASFPITSIIKEDTAKIEIKWNSYMVSGSVVSPQTTELSVEKAYTKSTFEQVPDAAASNAANYSIN